VNEEAVVAWIRAQGESLEADTIQCIDTINMSRKEMVLTERERLFAMAALNSSGLSIMSSN
jgi:hypothetical protein